MSDSLDVELRVEQIGRFEWLARIHNLDLLAGDPPRYPHVPGDFHYPSAAQMADMVRRPWAYDEADPRFEGKAS